MHGPRTHGNQHPHAETLWRSQARFSGSCPSPSAWPQPRNNGANRLTHLSFVVILGSSARAPAASASVVIMAKSFMLVVGAVFGLRDGRRLCSSSFHNTDQLIQRAAARCHRGHTSTASRTANDFLVRLTRDREEESAFSFWRTGRGNERNECRGRAGCHLFQALKTSADRPDAAPTCVWLDHRYFQQA